MCNKVAPIAKDDDDDSIFIRNQYIEINDVKAEEDWRTLLLDEIEIQKIGMFLIRRAYEIFSGEKPIKQQSLSKSKSKYIELTQGSFQNFIDKNYEIVQNFTGTSWQYFMSDFKAFSKNTMSKQAFLSLVEDAGLEKNRDRYYRNTRENNVFTQVSDGMQDPVDRVMVTVVVGLKPKIIAKTSQVETSTKSVNNDGLKSSM